MRLLFKWLLCNMLALYESSVRTIKHYMLFLSLFHWSTNCCFFSIKCNILRIFQRGRLMSMHVLRVLMQYMQYRNATDLSAMNWCPWMGRTWYFAYDVQRLHLACQYKYQVSVSPSSLISFRNSSNERTSSDKFQMSVKHRLLQGL